MSINLTATSHTLELVTTGTGAVHVVASFIDDNAGTKTGGSQTTIISSATTTTIVSAPGASIQRSVHHINIQAVAGNTVTVQKDVAATDHTLIGPVVLLAGERLEFTASVGWKKTNTAGLIVVSFPAIADDTFPANTSGSTNAPSAKTFTSLAGTGLTYNATTHALDTTGVSVPTISDQRVLGNDSGASATPVATTVHQVMDWIGGGEQWLFDGVNDLVDFGDVHAFERTQAFTLSIWTNSGFYIGKSFPTSINTNQRGYAFQLNAGGNIAVRLNNNIATSAALVMNSTSTVTVSETTHFVLTYDGSSSSAGITVYMNGSTVPMTTVSGSVAATIVSTAHLCIGGKEDGVGVTGGLQRHAAIWTSELTGAEVLEVYNSGVFPDLNDLPTAPTPIFWVKMDEDDATGANGIIDHGSGSNEGTAQNGLAPIGAIGNLPVRGSTTWQLVAPGASGTALTSNGATALPSFRQIGLNGLPSMAAGTVLTNITAGSAVPTAHTWSTLAGDGLTYTNVTGILAVGGSTSITVNANDIQRAALTGAITASANSNTTAFGTLAAKSVLANATNATAVPAALAGSAAFQHLRVNSANTGLEWSVLTLAAFPTMAAGSFLANVTAGTAVPTAHDLATLAGAGLTYTNVTGIMAVGAGTGITVNANDVAVNYATTTNMLTGTATNVAANPDSVAALWEAGTDNADGATITLGEGGCFNLITSTTAITAFAFSTDKAGRRAVIRFNTTRTLTHNATSLILPTAASITTAVGDQCQIQSLGSGNFRVNWYQRADGTPLAGSLAAIADDTFLANVSGGSAVPTGKTFTSLAGDSLSYDATGHNIDYIGTTNEVNLNAITGAQGVVDVSAMVCGGRLTITAPTGAWSISGFTAKPEGFWFVITVASTDFAGTIINSTTATTGIRNPGFVDFTCNRQMSGLVMYGAFGGGTQWLFIPGALDPAELALQIHKPRSVCKWHEDFEFVENDTVELSATSSVAAHFGNTHWGARGTNSTNLIHLTNEQGHPGILRLSTLTTDNSFICIHRGGRPDATQTWIRGDEIYEFEVIIRSTFTQTKALSIGFSEDPSSVDITGVANSHIMAFMFDSDNASLDVNIQCVTRESDGVATVTDSGVSIASIHATWISLRMLQSTVGTIEFFINDALVATHSTQVPDSESLNCGLCVFTRDASATVLDVDYINFEARPVDRLLG